MGMNFKAACLKIGKEIKVKYSPYPVSTKRKKFIPHLSHKPSLLWQQKATQFASLCHQELQHSENAIGALQERGFSQEGIHTFGLGYHSIEEFLSLEEWGLPTCLNDQGKERKLWLPKGLVVPTYSDNNVIKLKIRRSNWTEGDPFPKYVEISGSMKAPSIYGKSEIRNIIIVEAEFDAMLIQQFASKLCCSMAIGGASKKPDADCDHLLRQTEILLFSLDFDDAGRKAFQFWKSTYPNIKAWPSPRGKSPETALKEGTDLKQWIIDGLKL